MDYAEMFRAYVCLTESPKIEDFEQAKANLLTVPEIAGRMDIKVTPKNIRVSWKDGGQIVKTDRHSTEFLLEEIAKAWPPIK